MKKFFAFVAAVAFAGSMMAATSMTCAEAATAALSVSGNNVEYNDGEEIEVTGYVTGIKTAYSDQYHNISFWMADVADGGEVLQAFRAACATEADAPAVGDLVKVTGKLTKYNSTPEFAAACTYVILQGATPAPKYYVAGSMNGWGANEAYELVANPAVAGEYMGEFTFAANDEFKVIAYDGEQITTWYPDGMGNNYQITEAGEYSVYFRPEGNSEWGNGYFTAIKMEVLSVTVAQAIEAGMALDSMGVSTDEYIVEGYVINPGAFSLQYKNQSWYMADDATAESSDFQAYNCYPINNGDTLKVLAGDKVRLVGKLKKYYNRSANKYIIEIEKSNASFISMVPGDHTVTVITEEITVAQALEIGNALADGASTEKQYKIRGYVSAVDVKASDAYSEQYGNQSFYVADVQGSTAASNAEGAFYVYRGKPSTGEAIPYGAYVEFTNTIKKYVPSGGGDAVIENTDQNITITVLEAPEVQLDTVNVARACEIALALEDNAVSAQKYAIFGYVAKIKTEYSEQYGNISFFMTDDPEGTYGELQVYRGAISHQEGAILKQHDRVLVVGKLKNNYYNETNSAQTDTGAQVTIEWQAAIENIILTEKVDKVIMDGVLYIVRDGKLYNVQGVQVR